MKIYEKEKIIKFLDWLIEDIENVEYFNIKEFINKYKDISDHEKEYLPYSIESIGKTYNIFENTLNSDEWFKLTRKGIELKESEKGFNEFEKKLKTKPIDRYKIASIIISLLALYLGYLNYNLKRKDKVMNESVSELNIENASLKKTVEIYKDSLTESKGQLKSSEKIVIVKKKNDLKTN